MSDFNDNILIIGKPDSGKTTYLAQLYMRMQKRMGVVKLTKSPENIKAIEDAVERLSNGTETQSTPPDRNELLILPVEVENKKFELICPDYGGEQVNFISSMMEFDQTWKNRVDGSDNWMIFVRPAAVVNYYDLSNAGHEFLVKKRIEGHLSSPLSEQCQLIELLQALLYIKGIGIKSTVIKPKLVVVFTCWDELKLPTAPPAYFKETLPLLHDFIVSNWEAQSYKILGLSSQEFSLSTPEGKEKFQDEMPESFGYCVDVNGGKEKDITLIIKEAIQWK